jgi:hypothetical protein
MIGIIALQLGILAASGCEGADPAITDVTTSQTSNAGLTSYALKVTVTNLGSQAQSGNVMQSVVVRLDHEKNGEKGVPPLAAGAKYTFSYAVQRAHGSGTGTTTVDFRLIMDRPSGVGPQDCSTANDSQRVVL